MFDETGEVMTPVHTRNRHGTLYRYYVSASLQQGARPTGDGVLRRISASDLEKTLSDLLARWLPNEAEPLDYMLAIRLKSDGLLIDLEEAAAKEITSNLGSGETILHSGQGALRIAVPLALPLRGGKRVVIAGSQRHPRADPALIAALRKAHRMLAWSKGMPSLDASPASIYDRQVLRLALLAPDLQADILAGHQPSPYRSIGTPSARPSAGTINCDGTTRRRHSLLRAMWVPAPAIKFPALSSREFGIGSVPKLQQFCALAQRRSIPGMRKTTPKLTNSL